MTSLAAARALGAAGFHVFPCRPNDKRPMHEGWQDAATRTPTEWPDGANIGIFTERFGDDQALIVVDVDVKGAVNGNDSIFALDMEGHELPPTFEQSTPSGGRHLIYTAPLPVNPSVGKIAPAIDIRSRGSYIVGPGSVLENGAYTPSNRIRPALVPGWLATRAGMAKPRAEKLPTDPAIERARKYLMGVRPALEGDGGDLSAFKVAAKVKDMGVPRLIAFDLMAEHWNPRCQPPWELDDLLVKVNNAFKYGAEEPGNADPRTVFTAVPATDVVELSPFEKVNTEFAFVIAGDGHHVLWETTDADGVAELRHLSEDTFHKKHAGKRIHFGDKSEPLSKSWMGQQPPARRSYDGFVFSPDGRTDPRFYNLWRGFAVSPAASGDHPAVAQWIDHARANVCGGDDRLFRWLVGFFAHLVQRPAEKPLVSLVFRGGKGVGKNALVERVGSLLGGHLLVTANRRYLTGNFNGHLERCLMLVLDEAFWSGDKATEGIVKDLITGGHHVIEHKGKEPYRIRNLTRVVILGNEDWIVPASHDERRFAVFNVGDGRKQDREFFESMRVGMETGGYAHLLRYLLDFPVSDVNDAPITKALQDQKYESLDIFEQWWLDCLTEGTIVQSEFGGAWPAEITKEKFVSAFARYAKGRNVTARIPSSESIGKKLHKIAPSIINKGKTKDATGGGWTSAYRGLDLVACRAEWDIHMKSTTEWPS